VEKLKAGLAIPFHRLICPDCHAIPRANEWMSVPVTEMAEDSLDVFHVAKRRGKWEPFYIGTQDDPLFDERLSWEGRRDKMTQAYSMCLLDYDFAVLDNAFLVHRPGIKVSRRDKLRDSLGRKQNILIDSTIRRELQDHYGRNKKCTI